MEEKKYELTIEEIEMLIGIASADVTPDDVSESKMIELSGYSAYIAQRIRKHLDGTNPFKEECFRKYKNAKFLVESIKAFFGGLQ